MKMDLQEIEKKLLVILKQADTLLPENELQDMIALVRGGEPGIGLENFCTQLFEYDVNVPADILTAIVILGSAMGVRPHYWEMLKSKTE